MRRFAASSLFAGAVLAVAACSPAALPPEEIVPAFIAASQNAARTMHMEWDGTMQQPDFRNVPGGAAGSVTGTIHGSFDFSGPDYAGALETVMPLLSGDQTVSYARVGGTSYVSFGDSGWQRSGDFGGPAELDPLHDLAVGEVTYEAAETVDGRPGHRLRVLDPLSALTGSLFAQALFTGGQPTLNGDPVYLIYVDANGIPVGARVLLDLEIQTGPGVANTGSYKLDFTYAFSLWGEPVTINPPAIVGDGGGFDDPMPQPKPEGR